MPDPGLGISTGPSNRSTDVDIDRKNGVDGWFDLRTLLLNIPETALVHMLSGGFYPYFDTGNLEIPNSVGKFASGIDIRGAGGLRPRSDKCH